MSKLTRRFIFIAFVVMFFVLSAIVLPYAFGYNLNWSGMRLQRTGMFDIATTPSGATIYLNDQTQTGLFSKLSGRTNLVKTPAKLTNLAPGTYQVKLELSGYWPWEKQLTIWPNETTYLEDVYFFKKNSPQLLVEAIKPLGLAESHNQKYLAALSPSGLTLFNWNKSDTITTIPLSLSTSQQLAWSPNDEKIVVGNLVIDIKTKNIVDLKSFSQMPIKKIVWADKDLIYWQDKSGLNWLNLKDNKEGLVLGNKIRINDFTIKDGYLYYTSTEPKAYLNIRKLGDNRYQAKIKLADNGSYSLINIPDYDLLIKNDANNNAYLINSRILWSKNYGTQFIGPLTTLHFVDKNHLVYANNFELFDWNKSATNPTLLTRISYPILNITWHKSNNYIVFATNKNINTLELDDRDTHNITNILELDSIAYPLINKAGDKVILWSEINSVNGFYFIEI